MTGVWPLWVPRQAILATGRTLRERLGATEVQREEGTRENVRLAERDGVGEHGEGRGTAHEQEFLGACLGHSGPESPQTGPS